MTHKRVILLLTMTLLLALSSVQVVRAQTAAELPALGVETVRTVSDAARKTALETANQAKTEEGRNKAAAAVAAQEAQIVAKKTSAATAPDGFASRIHNSYQDYLNLLSFAINKVDESTDGQSLIIRFNPLQSGRNRLGLTGTFSKPTIYASVTNAIPESVRDSIVAKIKDQQNDLEDVTISIAYSLDTKTCSLKSKGRCYGRDPRAYRDLFSELMYALPAPDTSSVDYEIEQTQMRLDKLPSKSTTGLMDRPIASFERPDLARELATKLGTLQGEGTRLERQFYQDKGFAALENLFDNQPQLSAVGSYRTLGTYGGPDEWSVGLDLQVGAYNVNRLRRDSRGDATRALTLLKDYAASDSGLSKLVFSVNYKSTARFRLAQLDLGQGPVTGFSPVDQKPTSELTTKAQWGAKLDQKVDGRQPRVDLSLEGIYAFEDSVRTKDRWVATATLTIPLGDTINIPVSIAWANKPEFLGQPSKRLGAHLGLTYRLPWETNASP